METLIVDNKVLYEIFYQSGIAYMRNIGILIILILILTLICHIFLEKYFIAIGKVFMNLLDRFNINIVRNFIKFINLPKYVYVLCFILLWTALFSWMGLKAVAKYNFLSHSSYKYLMDSYDSTKYDNILQLKYKDFKVISTTDSTFILKK